MMSPESHANGRTVAESASAAGFSLTACVACDVEVFPGWWCVGFHGCDSDGNVWVRQVTDRDSLAKILNWIAERQLTVVTYNGSHYDVPVMRVILSGFDPYSLSRAIVADKPWPVTLDRLPAFPCDHVDLAKRLERAGRFPSLKVVAPSMGRHAPELPFDPHAALDLDQQAAVRAYNKHDLENTWALLLAVEPTLDALTALSTETGFDCRSLPESQVGERYYDQEHRRRYRSAPPKQTPPQHVTYSPPPCVRRPSARGAAEWHDGVLASPIPVTADGKPSPRKAIVKVGGLALSVGGGGIHSKDLPKVYYATRERDLVHVDVRSFYPSLIARHGLLKGLHGGFLDEFYRGLLDRRLALKVQAEAADDPAERERLGKTASALKLILNSVFGKLGSRFSPLYDPAGMIAVTLTGQLVLIDLIERLAGAGARVVSANTDGLVYTARKGNAAVPKALEQWQADTQLELSVEPLRRFATLSTNHYAMRAMDNSVTQRGRFRSDFTPTTVPSAPVVGKAITRLVLFDEPVERTVRACRDAAMYCYVSHHGAETVAAELVDDGDGTRTPLPRVVRFYKARESKARISHQLKNGKTTTPRHAVKVRIVGDARPGWIPKDLDWAWYAAEAQAAVCEMRGYRHLSRKRLGGNAMALEAHARGLVPIPKRSKKAPLGYRRDNRPTYAWPWGWYPAVGTHTGPDAGLAVLDVDDHPRFKVWANRGGPVAKRGRVASLAGCLVSVHGEATADEVRQGLARGKLVFSVTPEQAARLARVSQKHWTRSRGIELFCGHGVPTLLGSHPSGETYRLEGTLTPLPQWMFDELLPSQNGPSTDGVTHNRDVITVNGNDDPELFESLPDLIGKVDPRLTRERVGWHRKDLGGDREIWVGKCPFPHASDVHGDTDLSAGIGADGVPHLSCFHTSCEGSREANRAVGDHFRRSKALAGPPLPLEPTPICQTFLDDLAARRTAFHKGPTGSGKTFAMAQAAALRLRQGLCTVIAVPTLRLAAEIESLIYRFDPRLEATDLVAVVCGQRVEAVDGDDAGEESADDAEPGSYPIHVGTRIIICTHAQLGRRGYSRFMRPIWSKLGPEEKDGESRPAFALIIDETAELVRMCRQSIALAHRFKAVRDNDHGGGRHQPIVDCPMFTRSGSCGNCTLAKSGGEPRYNRFGIRELVPPRQSDVNENGDLLRTPKKPLVVDEHAFRLGPEIQVGPTTFACAVRAYGDHYLSELTRTCAPLDIYRAERDGVQPKETHDQILAHMMQFAGSAVVVRERPIDVEEEMPVASETLKLRKMMADAQGGKGKPWVDGIQFPSSACEVPTLRFTDAAALEQIRRFAGAEHVGIVFTGATLSDDDLAVLARVWPEELVTRDHPYPDRKIAQAALVLVDERKGTGSLRHSGGYLVTRPLERFPGLGLVFCARKRLAKSLHDSVFDTHPTCRLAEENYETLCVRKSLHTDGPCRTFISYARGVLGLGANLKDVIHLVVDVSAFRAIGTFNPEEVSPEAFAEAQSQERLNLILQNIGRAFRGEAGKLVVLFILNADDRLKLAIGASPAIVEGCELPPVVVTGTDLTLLVDEAGRWLEAGGGEWPERDTAKSTAKAKGRPKGKGKRTKESVMEAAEKALAAGDSWGDFRRSQNPQRTLTPDELEALKARFLRPARTDDEVWEMGA